MGQAVAQYVSPIHIPEYAVQHFRVVPYAVESAHNTSDGRSSHDIDRNTRFFQHFDNADMGRALGTASRQYQSHLFTSKLIFLRLGESGGRHHHQTGCN